MAKKQVNKFVLGDIDEEFCILDGEVYISKEDAINYASTIIEECEDEACIIVYQLTPMFKVSKPKTPMVCVEDL